MVGKGDIRRKLRALAVFVAGSIDGISGRCDLDESYKDYSKIIRDNGLNGFPNRHQSLHPSPFPSLPKRAFRRE